MIEILVVEAVFLHLLAHVLLPTTGSGCPSSPCVFCTPKALNFEPCSTSRAPPAPAISWLFGWHCLSGCQWEMVGKKWSLMLKTRRLW